MLPVQAPEPEDLAFCGALEYYDKGFDRVTPKTERPIKKTGRAFRSVTTSDDPVIRCSNAPCLADVIKLVDYPSCTDPILLVISKWLCTQSRAALQAPGSAWESGCFT